MANLSLAAEPQERWSRGRASATQSALVSMVCHLIALIALGLFTVAAQQANFGVDLCSEMIGTPDSAGNAEMLSANVIASDGGASTAAGPETLFSADIFAAADVPGPRVELAVGPRPNGLLGDGIGSGGDGHGLTAAGPGSEFFGIGGSGKTFVYVLDCSDSMNNDDRFRRAREELIYSIERLSREQNFFVILYNDVAIPMDADDPVPAVPKEIERVHDWLDRAIPTGGTNPLPALEYAISLQPDAIYFLSDGEFEPIVIAAVREKNRKTKLHPRQIPIHTIAFASQAGEHQMKILARTSGGKYRFVK